MFFKATGADYGINLFFALPGGVFHFYNQLKIEGHEARGNKRLVVLKRF
jgi:hypothetical protein